MDRRGALLAAVALALLPSPVAAEDDPAAWIYFDSREAAKGPVLAVESASGVKSEIPAAADTVVISYLNTFLGGGHAQLSVDLGDRNRVLLRFEVPAGPKLRKAELVLQVGLPPKPPKDPFPVALFPVEGDWEEASASWGRQPAYGRKSVQKAVVPIKVAPCRINVTEAVNGWIAHPETNRGWLLRVNKPLPDRDVAGSTPPPPPPGPTEGPLPDIRALYRWAPNARDAVKRAEAEGRMVLALVDGSADPAAPSFGASLVLSILLADPDIRALVEARFVPVQVGYQPGFYTAKGSVPNDPLQPLGSPAASVKGPALLVADAKGKTAAVLEGIGTWDREAVLRFLSEALPPLRGEKDPWRLLAGGSLKEAAAILAKDGGHRAAVGLARIEALGGNHAKAVDLLFPLCEKGGAAEAEARTYSGVSLLRLGRTAEAAASLAAAADLEGPERARALYFLGCVLWHEGKAAEARRAWERIGAECAASPWTVPAKNRLAAPERFAAFENLSAAPFAAGSRTTEVPAARADLPKVVARAADYLLERQNADGSWPVGEHGQAMCIPGITALCARALLEWQDGIGKERGERAGKAVAKAVAWLRERWTAEPPSNANSFCAAYVLAFHLARMEKDPEARTDAVAVLPQLLGGQCDNGAWSYDRRFGESWRGGFGGWPKTDRGRVHSMNTGLALCALVAARDAGLEIDGKAIARGSAALKRMKTGPAAFTYTWPDPISFERADLSLGRAILCENALSRTGAGSDLNVAIENFMERRACLRGPVKLTPSWTMPGGVSSYFYFFAYFHAVEAMAGNPSRQYHIDQLADDLLAVVEADGTWVDYPAIGKPYATAMALLVLRKATK